MGVDMRHGGNREAAAARLNCRPSQLLDASASLAPWSLRSVRIPRDAIRDYPDRGQTTLCQAIARLHGLDPDALLPGNGAAELFTWAARDAAAGGAVLFWRLGSPTIGGLCSAGVPPGLTPPLF